MPPRGQKCTEKGHIEAGDVQCSLKDHEGKRYMGKGHIREGNAQEFSQKATVEPEIQETRGCSLSKATLGQKTHGCSKATPRLETHGRGYARAGDTWEFSRRPQRQEIHGERPHEAR